MKHLRSMPVFLVAVLILVLGGASPNSWADEHGDEMPFNDAEIFIEFNSTDEDAGIQVFLDGDDWREVTISDPNDNTIFRVKGKKALGWLGLTELFFESVEPELIELPLQDFLDLFPEGEYEFEGKTNNGITLESEAEFTHVIPCGPEFSPEDGEVLDPSLDVVISWEPVTGVIDPATEECEAPVVLENAEVTIESYQVIIERDDPLGDLVIDLPGDASMVTIPPELIEPGLRYNVEVLAKEESGNQTITEQFFCTEPLDPCPEE